MKITKTQLKQIIKEELGRVLNEEYEPDFADNIGAAALRVGSALGHEGSQVQEEVAAACYHAGRLLTQAVKNPEINTYSELKKRGLTSTLDKVLGMWDQMQAKVGKYDTKFGSIETLLYETQKYIEKTIKQDVLDERVASWGRMMMEEAMMSGFRP